MFSWIRFSLHLCFYILLYFKEVQKTPPFVELFVEACSPMVDFWFRCARVKSLGSHPCVQWRPAPAASTPCFQVEVGECRTWTLAPLVPLTHSPDVAAKGNCENNTTWSYSPMRLDVRLGLPSQQKVLLPGRTTKTRGWKSIPCALLSRGLRLLGFSLEDLKHVATKTYFCACVRFVINTEIYGRSRAGADLSLLQRTVNSWKSRNESVVEI